MVSQISVFRTPTGAKDQTSATPQVLPSAATPVRPAAESAAVPAASATQDVADTDGQATQPAVDQAALETAVRTMEASAQRLHRALQFSIDESSGRTVITVIDKTTNEIIRQIPDEEVLSLADHFADGKGGLVEVKA